MRVIIDARMVGPVQHGIARYVKLMAAGLAGIRQQAGGLSYEPVFLVQPELPDNLREEWFGGFEQIEVSTPFLHPSELWALRGVLKKGGADLYHSPSFSCVIDPPCPWIATVHDLNHLHFGGRAKKLYYRAFLRPFIRKAAAVLTVSEFSRHEIAEWSGYPEAKIELAYNAMDPLLTSPLGEGETDAVLNRLGLRRNGYILCMSNPKPHKNVRLLVEAYAEFRRQTGDADVPELALTMREYGHRKGVVSVGGLKEREARAVLSAARALFFPSLYEGFGLPPVEAAVLGVPLAVSTIPPHREGLSELAAGEVHWVDPTDFHGWVNAFHRAHRGDLMQPSGASRQKTLARFGVAALGTRMDQVYRRVLGLAV